MTTMNMKNRGFTLIELLVVISIIGLLSSVVLGSLNTARAKARDSMRLQNLRELRTALELYKTSRGVYPNTSPTTDPNDADWRGSCTGLTWPAIGGTTGATGWIPNLAPGYISVLPLDPKPDTVNGYCYGYLSDGVDYMLLAYKTVETYSQTTNPAPRPGYSVGVNYQNDFAFYTPGARDW